jgi:hypothetical protein
VGPLRDITRNLSRGTARGSGGLARVLMMDFGTNGPVVFGSQEAALQLSTLNYQLVQLSTTSGGPEGWFESCTQGLKR